VRQAKLVQLEQADVRPHPLFVVAGGPILLAERLPRIAPLLDEPLGLTTGRQERLE
jgi:hypothetical protein